MINTLTKNGAMLAGFAIIATLVVSLTFTGTKKTIEQQQQARLKAVLSEVLPSANYDDAIYQNCVEVSHPLLGGTTTHKVYRAYQNDDLKALVFEATAPDGYSGNIEMVVGTSTDFRVHGVRVVSHSETPGLGDKIEPRVSDWIYGFSGQQFNPERSGVWYVKKDGGMFDQFTGATITPRAVVGAIRNTMMFLTEHIEELKSAPNACGITTEAES